MLTLGAGMQWPGMAQHGSAWHGMVAWHQQECQAVGTHNKDRYFARGWMFCKGMDTVLEDG